MNHNPAVLMRTQDLPPLWAENSCIYLFQAANLLRRHQRIGERPLLFEMCNLESTDIDDEHDWALAAAMMPGVLAAAGKQPHAAPPAPALDVVGAPAEAAAPPPAPAPPTALMTAQRLRAPLRAGMPPPAALFDVLVSAPYMLPHMPRFTAILSSFGLRAVVPPELAERLTEAQLLARAGNFDATICGDDAYTARVLAACAPRLKARA